MSTSTSSELTARIAQAWLLVLRHETKYTRFLLNYLIRRNQHSRAPVVDPAGPVLCVTTYGDRLKTVHIVLESIAAGSQLPSRMILWVDTREALDDPTPGLVRLLDRGLEIKLSENYGPHTKYYPYVKSTADFDLPLVTADDDLLYTDWWLAGMVKANREFPKAVHCYRAHSIQLANGTIAPYQQWKPCLTTEPSLLHFATGVSGCIYPPALLHALKQAGTGFLALCSKADDVWLHVQALRLGMPVRQVLNRPLRFPFVPGTQDSGLYHENVLLSRNDEQIQKTYTADDIALLTTASVR